MKSEFRASYYDIAYNTFISDIIITLRNHSLNCSTKQAWKKLAIVKIIGMTTAVISDLNKFNIANIKLGDNAVFYLKLSVFAISIWETWLDLIVDDYKISIQDTATFFFMASTLTHLSVLFLAIYSPANLDNAVNATLNIIEK